VHAALAAYDVVKSLHIMAALAAYGLPLAYPLLVPYVRRNHPEALPGVHAVQYRLNNYLTGPGTVLILLLGAYLASEHDLWGEPWVIVPLAILVVIGAVGGGVIVPATRRLSELDVASPEYARLYSRYMRAELLLGVLVLVAVFFMTAKPFA
jgi:uncharacterized membrane protein